MLKRREILFGASAAMALPSWSIPEKKTVRFIQITDTHFGQPDRDHETAMKKLVAQINTLPMHIDFAIHTGDIMHDNILDESAVAKAKKSMEGLNVPIHYTAGNHDIVRKQQQAMQAAYVKHFGELLEVHEYNGFALVSVYTEPLANDFRVPGFNPLEELESALDRLKGTPVVVAHHIPCAENVYKNRAFRGWPADQRAAWDALLNKHGVKGVVAGHFHRDELFWLNKVPVHVAPPVSNSYGRQPAFRIYTFEQGRLSHRSQYLIGSSAGT